MTGEYGQFIAFCSFVLCCAVLCWAVLCCAVLCFVVLLLLLLRCVAFYCILRYCTAMHCTHFSTQQSTAQHKWYCCNKYCLFKDARCKILAITTPCLVIHNIYLSILQHSLLVVPLAALSNLWRHLLSIRVPTTENSMRFVKFVIIAFCLFSIQFKVPH